MLNLNKLMVTGNVARDSSEKMTQGGKSVCEFSMRVTSRSYRDQQGNWQDEGFFLDVTKFDGQYRTEVRKGDEVYAEGVLKEDRWQDRQTGAGRSKLVMVASVVKVIRRKDQGQGGGYGQQASRNPAGNAYGGQQWQGQQQYAGNSGGFGTYGARQAPPAQMPKFHPVDDADVPANPAQVPDDTPF